MKDHINELKESSERFEENMDKAQSSWAELKRSIDTVGYPTKPVSKKAVPKFFGKGGKITMVWAFVAMVIGMTILIAKGVFGLGGDITPEARKALWELDVLEDSERARGFTPSGSVKRIREDIRSELKQAR